MTNGTNKARDEENNMNVAQRIEKLNDALKTQGEGGFFNVETMAHFFNITPEAMKRWLQTAHEVWGHDEFGCIVHIDYLDRNVCPRCGDSDPVDLQDGGCSPCRRHLAR